MKACVGQRNETTGELEAAHELPAALEAASLGEPEEADTGEV